MIAFTHKLQQNTSALVFSNREPHTIGATLRRYPGALAGVAQVAEFAQFSITRSQFGTAGPACPAKTCSERQPRRKIPVNIECTLMRKEERTSHGTHILLSKPVDCVEFFAMEEMNRLQMLTQFLALNPSDAFARYGLAMEYSKTGQTEEALSQFSRLLELHPDYTNGYFMAAQTLERAGRTPEAKAMLEKGIDAAKRTGARHALSEMSGMLEEIS
jgi:Tetratricopeptide repeat